MLDKIAMRENPEKFRQLLLKKGIEVDFTEFLHWIKERNSLIFKMEEQKAKKNQISDQIFEIKKKKDNPKSLFIVVNELSSLIDLDERKLRQIENDIDFFVSNLPNIPDEDLVGGGQELNEVLYSYLEKPVFHFPIKDHVFLCESLHLIDYERAAKISGKGTWIYRGNGAILEWALLNFFISEHLKDCYEFILPPHILNQESGFAAGQFPKFNQDVFWMEGQQPKKFLLPTAETALINLHRNEILKEIELPKKYFAYSPCYRQEAGSYRTEERGTIRGYQFNKVEMVQITKPDQSDSAFVELLAKAENLMKQLGLHYRVSKLAAGDLAFAMARTYDIEVWLPSLEIYKEVSSVSNARDFQARRGMIRYKDAFTKKNAYCHTLNASGLATSRLIPAIVEQFQLPDGSVKIPDVLVPFMNGISIFK